MAQQVVPDRSHQVRKTKFLHALVSFAPNVSYRTGQQKTMVIQSGSDKHRLRRFHQILANIKYLTHPDRAEELALYYNVG